LFESVLATSPDGFSLDICAAINICADALRRF
jgi:hypothetical protein